MTVPSFDYARFGPEGLGDADLLSLVLGNRPAADTLLDRFGTAAALLAASPAALADAVGQARATRLHAALALARRAAAGAPPRPTVRSPSDAAAWLVPRLTGLDHEELHALFLDARSCVIALRRMSQGSPDHTLFDVRHVLGETVRVGARALIVGHNHPSGEVEPSGDDLLVTRRLAEGAALLGVDLQDHLVVAGPRWTSMAERGELPRTSTWGPRTVCEGGVTRGPSA
ncbi:hypothetical protein LBMAG42_41560 [Deltaproteobacteria bacterium]|nr:hypothetical protein LBMAG42_41560 [Deltaproteobacteria bacterium]